MRLIIDLILVLILAISIWTGYKRGLIRSIIGLASLILVLVVSNILATNISRQLVPAVEPFVSGYIDSDTVTAEVLANMGYADSDKSLNDVLNEDSSLKEDYAYECMRAAGFFRDASEDLAQDAVNYATKNNISMTDSVITVICNTAAYVLCVTIIFTVLIILMNVILDMLNLNAKLPNAELVDDISGAAIGFVKGMLTCILLCWLLGFLGLIIGKKVSDKGLMSFFLAFRFITRTLI